MKKLLLILTVVLVLVSCSREELVLDENQTNTEVESNDSNEVSIVNEILRLVNDHRQSLGKATLTLNDVATELAIDHTNFMIEQNAIGHSGFEARFETLKQQVNAKNAGENVAAGYSTAESVMNGWLNSSGHKANIEGNFTHIGIAAIKNSRGSIYYTQLFYR